MRLPEEALLVVYRPGPEYLVLLRAPDGGGYWHLVAGGLEGDEGARAAALRELGEETGLAPSRLEALPLELGYERPDGVRITLHPFLAEAPAGWEPVLDEEHTEYRWCSAAAAVELLEFPEPRAALREVARQLGDA